MPKINLSVAAGRNAVASAIKASGRKNPDIWVACSGGADSLALVASAKFYADRNNLNLYVINIDHNLQAGSDEVSRQAKRICSEFGVPEENFFIETLDIDINNGGLENAAREARYGAIEQTMSRISGDGDKVVLTGHTMDDQAETVLLSLTRGSGAKSISGIPPQRGDILRPFLIIRRSDTEAICDTLGIEYWDDPTNFATEDGPMRSILRNTIMPELANVLGDSVSNSLARTADMARADEEFISAQVDTWMSANLTDASGTYSCDLLATLPEALLGRVLKRIAEKETSTQDINHKHVTALKKYVINYNGQHEGKLPAETTVMRKNRQLIFIK